MNKLCFSLAAAAMMAAQIAQAAPPLSVLLTHELTEQGGDGVTRTTRYQERFIRDGDNIWIERVLPAWTRGEAYARKVKLDQDHNELDVHVAPRLAHPTVNGGASLMLVDPNRRATFSAGPEDYEHLGFSGRWSAEASLIDPASLKHMKLSPRPAEIAGARWYEQETATDYTRILWSDALQFPLAIETGARDGRYASRTAVRIASDKQAQRPWLQLRGYAAREMSDLGD